MSRNDNPGNRLPMPYPITALPVFAAIVDRTSEDSRHQYDALLSMRGNPRRLDDATIDRVNHMYLVDWPDADIFFRGQLQVWEADPGLTDEQKSEIIRLYRQIDRIRHLAADTAALASEIRQDAIDLLLDQDLPELVFDVTEDRYDRSTF